MWNPKQRGIIGTQPLVATAFLAVISFIGVFLMGDEVPHADMRIEPLTGVVLKDTSFTIRVIVTADVPVNVFKGELHFDTTKMRVASIDYNTSIANLWAEKPWYENGDGTLNFIGGTSREGGFLGTGVLMTVTFTSIEAGPALVYVRNARILAHDGLGSDVSLQEPIDALFTVDETSIASETIAMPTPPPAAIAMVNEFPQTDINQDGKQTIADVSIFMVGMVKGDLSLDFTGDGKVNISDLSILLSIK